MSCLPMTVRSFFRSITGLKWETRRIWKAPRVQPGGSYRILRIGVDGLFTPRAEAPAFAIVNDVWTEPLGEIDQPALVAEGGFTMDEFKHVWRGHHGEWDPTQEVYVNDYDTVLEDPQVAT